MVVDKWLFYPQHSKSLQAIYKQVKFLFLSFILLKLKVVFELSTKWAGLNSNNNKKYLTYIYLFKDQG